MTEQNSNSPLTEFIGVLPEDKRLSFARYMTSLSSFEIGKSLLLHGRIRDRSLTVIDKVRGSNHLGTVERSFRNITGHELTVAASLNALSSMMGFSDEGITTATIAGYAHDATKPTQIVLDNFRIVAVNQGGENGYSKGEVQSSRRIAQEWLEYYNLPAGDLLNRIETSGPEENIHLFEQDVNIPILNSILREAGVDSKERDELLTLASCDTWNGMPNMIAMTARTVGDKGEKFSHLVSYLLSRNRLPKVSLSEQDQLMAMMLWYTDAIAAGDTLRTVDGRIDELEHRIDYSELNTWAKEFYGIESITEVNRILNHSIEEVLMDKLIAAGKIKPDTPASELPILILNHILESVNSFAESKK